MIGCCFSFDLQWFFLFSLWVLNTFSLKLSEVNFTILHCRPYSSILPMGWVLSIFLITMSLLISLSFARVLATLSKSFSSSPGKHGRLEYCSWQSIFVSSKELPNGWLTNVLLALKSRPPNTLLSLSGNLLSSVVFLKVFYLCCCWSDWEKRCDYTIVVLLVVSILTGVDFVVFQLLLDDLVIWNLYLFDLNLLWVDFLNWIFQFYFE